MLYSTDEFFKNNEGYYRVVNVLDILSMVLGHVSDSVFVFLISSILYHHPALFHRHTLILEHVLTFLQCWVKYSKTGI